MKKIPLESAGWVIVNQYLENGVSKPRTVFGPYPTKEAAEKANTEEGFPNPELNEIVRIWDRTKEKN